MDNSRLSTGSILAGAPHPRPDTVWIWDHYFKQTTKHSNIFHENYTMTVPRSMR